MEQAVQRVEPTDNILEASGALDATRDYTEIRLTTGPVLRISTHVLIQAANAGAIPSTADSPHTDGTLVLPVMEERLEVTKRVIPTGTIQLEKRIEEYYQELDVPLSTRTFDIERVSLNQQIASAPPVRREGDTTIYSLVEEQLVLTTQLILKEELRVTMRDSERRDNRTVTLKREIVDVNRSKPF